ncbi:SPOR domain-containing protein [Oxalobacteraceae bacterium CAVE-383]|nr:SPOR domain-containing protein [Oxalobacteraceae bacterium CAVE-383]
MKQIRNQKSNRYQQGGTFLGIIIGLVVGLGIAVVVALMITKSPIPFTNGKTLRPERAPDPVGDQVADPNKLLYGSKEAARQAARDQKAAEAAAAPAGQAAGVPPVVAATPAPASPPALPPTGADQPKNQVSSATPAPKLDGDDKWIYYLQAGAFREQADAENARAKLALLGMEAKVSEKQSDNGSLFRVRLGPYAQLDAMNRVRAKLAENSVDAALVRIPK